MRVRAHKNFASNRSLPQAVSEAMNRSRSFKQDVPSSALAVPNREITTAFHAIADKDKERRMVKKEVAADRMESRHRTKLETSIRTGLILDKR
ncbi:hypothetical protein HN011_005587 [Eciton burchellii]|nr:hypothetical protein HN011_005587 [Eciton burchellii]